MEPQFASTQPFTISPSYAQPFAASSTLYRFSKQTLSSISESVHSDEHKTSTENIHTYQETSGIYPISGVNYTQTNSKDSSPGKKSVRPFRGESAERESFKIYNSSARRRVNLQGSHISGLLVYYNTLEQMVDLLKDTKKFLRDTEE